MNPSFEIDGLDDNPLDAIEELIAFNEWPFDRNRNDELTVWIGGGWCTYQLWFLWRSDPDVLYVSCTFDVKVAKTRRTDIHTLLTLINERTWLGHFALSADDDVVTFRHAQLVNTIKTADNAPWEALIEIALSECERYFPAFQFVLWGGKSPPQAISAALLETQGSA
ncbi:MAG: YbjN domain-containing protein [Proteobacteria bacterium]|nr:YbjN domain-containing protein [Pseudomonadota bacterium]